MANHTWPDVGTSFADWLVGGDGFGIGVSQDASPFTSDQTLSLKKAFEASTQALAVELAKMFQQIEIFLMPFNDHSLEARVKFRQKVKWITVMRTLYRILLLHGCRDLLKRSRDISKDS